MESIKNKKIIYFNDSESIKNESYIKNKKFKHMIYSESYIYTDICGCRILVEIDTISEDIDMWRMCLFHDLIYNFNNYYVLDDIDNVDNTDNINNIDNIDNTDNIDDKLNQWFTKNINKVKKKILFLKLCLNRNNYKLSNDLIIYKIIPHFFDFSIKEEECKINNIINP